MTASVLIYRVHWRAGLSTATAFKLIEVKSGWQTNWHSILEQTYGAINGIGIGFALLYLAANPTPSREYFAVPGPIPTPSLSCCWLLPT